MAPSFGTSGLRGLVVELTADLVGQYVHAFLSTVDTDTLYIGQDLRPSSPDIAATIAAAAVEAGVDVVECGALPTPALALASMAAGAAAIMVTGSHIPADRNGLKFYVPAGEITKDDEQAITAAYAAGARRTPTVSGAIRKDIDATSRYVARYVDAFGAGALDGLRIGVYRHSSAARDVMAQIFADLGATVIPLGHSDTFIPVDTEAVDANTRAQLLAWCAEHELDAIASTDGDADRPLLTDAAGQVVPGDVLGVLSARYLGADVVVTPVSSNDMVRRIPAFQDVYLTRIGSPYVIAEMTAQAGRKTVGFEANGGFLMGFDGALAALPTRDCMLPILAPLHAAKRSGKTLADLVADLPPCFTAADRLQEIDRPRAAAFLDGLITDARARATFFGPFGAIVGTDLTDGLRVDFAGGDVAHLRPSGNAPEFRIYAQSGSQARAHDLMNAVKAAVASALTS